MAFLVATTSLPAVYRPNGYARTMTAGTPHARANIGFNIRFQYWVQYLGSLLGFNIAFYIKLAPGYCFVS